MSSPSTWKTARGTQALDPVWNTVIPELIGAIRGQDQHRTILLGPRTMNNARFLGELTLPEEERNLIVGIHHYWPITFTMQGEMWLGEDHVFGSPRDWLGTTVNADLASRARWTRFNRRLAEQHGIPWGIWSLAPTFAIYDPSARSFNPQLLAALMD